MLLSRRHLFRSAATVAVAVPALKALAACAVTGSRSAPRIAPVALAPDASGLLDLAPGLSCTLLTRKGDTMSDGLPEPGDHDGMGCFPVAGDPDRCVLVRNHELSPGEEADGPFPAGVGAFDPARIYDTGVAGPVPGGTTSLIVNTRTQKVEKSWVSLAGTAVNCAGGPTPWGSWLTCEETQLLPGDRARKAHGFVFEVPSAATGPVEPVALTGLGRYAHEAAAVDPETGIVYLTEDTGDSLFYRFLPDAPGELAKGGRLQALALVAQPGADTCNWTAAQGGDSSMRFVAGERHAVRWIDMDAVESPDGDLRLRGRQKGAAIFARGEGMAFALENGRAAIYFACTSGGAAQLGQVWRYQPGEGGGQLELYVESNSPDAFEAVDNIVATPAGDLLICEDGPGDNFVRIVTPDGVVFPIVRNAHPGRSEFCGACFSPDGRTLFVNVQRPGFTFAITGDWAGVRRAAVLAA